MKSLYQREDAEKLLAAPLPLGHLGGWLPVGCFFIFHRPPPPSLPVSFVLFFFFTFLTRLLLLASLLKNHPSPPHPPLPIIPFLLAFSLRFSSCRCRDGSDRQLHAAAATTLRLQQVCGGGI